MENLRIRTRKEVENSATYSVTKFAKDVLNVVDVLELAVNGARRCHYELPQSVVAVRRTRQGH